MNFFINKFIFCGMWKNPRCLKNPRINPRPSGKSPRTQDSVENPKILWENPRSGNAGSSHRPGLQKEDEAS